MVIDAHFHAVADTSPADLPQVGCLVSKQSQQNDYCLQVARNTELVTALYVEGRSGEIEKIAEAIRHAPACAYAHTERMHVSWFERLMPIYQASVEFGRPIFLHLSHHDNEKLPHFDAEAWLKKTLEKYPDLMIVIPHIGGENSQVALTYAAKYPNVWLDISCIEETVKRARWPSISMLMGELAKTVPIDQILYGSDLTYPRSKDNNSKLVLHPFFDNQEVTRIMSDNASQLFQYV